MNTTAYTIFDFLRDCGGNWRNAIHITCAPCKEACTIAGRGCLLTADCEGRPRAISISRFEALTGQRVDPSECAGTLSKTACASAYGAYLLWRQDDEALCCLRFLDAEIAVRP